MQSNSSHAHESRSSKFGLALSTEIRLATIESSVTGFVIVLCIRELTSNAILARG